MNKRNDADGKVNGHSVTVGIDENDHEDSDDDKENAGGAGDEGGKFMVKLLKLYRDAQVLQLLRRRKRESQERRRVEPVGRRGRARPHGLCYPLYLQTANIPRVK